MVLPFSFHVTFLPFTFNSSACIVGAEAPLPVSNLATNSPNGFTSTISNHPHCVETGCLLSSLAK